MVLAVIIIKMELNMRGTGKMICSMDSVLNSGMITLNMKGTTLKVKNMAKVYILGRTHHITMETGKIIK